MAEYDKDSEEQGDSEQVAEYDKDSEEQGDSDHTTEYITAEGTPLLLTEYMTMLLRILLRYKL